MDVFVDLAELARATTRARRALRQPSRRPILRAEVLPWWQRWLLSCLTSAVLIVGAWREMPVQAVPLPGDAEKVARIHQAMTIEAENKRIADGLEAVAAELRRIQPAGTAAPDPAEIAARGGERSPLVIGEQVLAKVDALGDFETAIEQGWRAEAAEMALRGMPAEVVARHEGLIAEVRGRAVEFRERVTAMRNQLGQRSLIGTSSTLVSLSDWFARFDSARAFKAIGADQLPMQLARADRTPAPGVALAADKAAGIDAFTDPPGPADLAQTIDIQFTPAIQDLAQSLGGRPVAIRNWVHDHIEFIPTWGSIQGADQTLLNRRGNAFDIASLTLALMRTSGIPARYVRSVVELPVDRVQNWLDAPTPEIALDLMQKGGIPSAGVIVAGRLSAIRFEHVWVEAWVDFIPSRGAINRVPDQWVPLDVAYKQFDVVPAVPWQAPAQTAMNAAVRDLVSGITIDPDGGMRGFDIERYTRPMAQFSQQLGSTVPTQDGTYSLFDRRTIRAIGSEILEGTLPFPLRSTTIQRYSDLPAATRQSLRLAFFSSSVALTGDSPDYTALLPLARIGSKRLSVESVGATAADQTALALYAAGNHASLPAGQIRVIARLRLGSEVLHESAPARYGTLHFWRANLRDAHGAEASTEAYRFPAGTAMVFAANAAGFDADRIERSYAGLPEAQSVSTAEYLARAGDVFWLLHDQLDQRLAATSDARALRLPSVGSFSTAISVRYFFGVPRTASTAGFVTDVKAVRLALAKTNAAAIPLLAAQMGASGAMQEGAVWSLLSGGRPGDVGISAPSLLRMALGEGQRLFQINIANVDTALQAMSLSVDAENEIRQAVIAGNTVVAHAAELQIGNWRGSGYTIFDPVTGAQLQRVEGGFAGGLDVGCILKAVVLTVICKNRYFVSIRQFLQSLITVVNAAALGEDLLAAVGDALWAVGVGIAITVATLAFPVVGAVILTLSIIMAFIETYQWLKGIMEGLETMTPEERAEAGISAVNDAICNYNPACFEGFNEAAEHLANWTGVAVDPEAADGRAVGLPAVGNPVLVGTGAKWEYATDHEAVGPFPLAFRRVYHSALPNTESWLGPRWTGNYFQSLRLPPTFGGDPAAPEEQPKQVLLLRQDGGWLQFDWRVNAYVTGQNIPGRLERLTSAGLTTGWRYYTAADQIEQYDAVGRLQRISNRAGLTHTIARDSLGRPQTVTDSYGRTLVFGYDPESGLLATLTDTNQRITRYERGDFDRLERVIHPDNSDRRYHYEDPLNRYALTGVTDEREIRTATWTYDSQGRITLYERAGGVDRHSFAYQGKQTRVTDPLGTERTYEYQLFGERPYLRVVTQPCSACSAGGFSEMFYDSRGLLVETRDFRGNRTVYGRDDEARITSLSEAVDSSAVARSTTIDWTPAWRLPHRVVAPIEGGTRVTTIEYDDEGNPESRSVAADGSTRVWTYVHNDNGQLESEDGPRTDVADITTYTYDDDGNLETRTDALEHIWRYTQYDADGQLRRMEDPNGLVTRYTYDLRQRLTDVDEGGELTSYRYDDAGQLERITLPDLSYIEYIWDDAGRVEKVEDNLGHSIDYELDGLGNRTKEEIFDPDGTLVQTMHRVYDGLGRLKDSFGAEEQTTSYTYDGNGNEKTVVDPLLRLTGYDYDELDRLKKTTDPDNNEIEFSYDAQDNLRTVTDPRDLVTEYDYTGFDELETLTSPDTGVTGYVYDAAGNLDSRTDSRGVTADYSYDANQRLRSIAYPPFAGLPAETLGFDYDNVANGNFGTGRLTAISDGSGSTTFKYDVHGRVLEKRQTVGTGTSRTLATSYLPNGQLEGHVLPSGAIVRYTYRADGRMLTIRVNGVEIVREIDYHAFSEPKSWRYGATDIYQRVVDLDGRIEQHSAGDSVRTLHYDLASRIDGQTDSAGGPNQWAYGYDDLDRLESASNAGNQGAIANLVLGWDYDPTGNRIQETRGANPSVPFAIALDSNRLDSVNAITRAYDDAGNTLNDGAGLTSVYNARNRLIRTTKAGLTTHYAHNAFGERVCKGSAGPTCAQSADRIEYVYDDDGHLIGEYAPNLADHTEILWLDDTPIALLKRRPGSSDGSPGGSGTATAWAGMAAGGVDVYYIQPDHLDTPRVLVNAANAPIWRWDSAPFGDTAANENPTVGLPSFTLNLRFPGQQYDRETGTHYNYFRDHEAGTGRYVQSDPIGLNDGFAIYGYTKQDPIAYFDISGLKRGGKKKCNDCSKADWRDYEPSATPTRFEGPWSRSDCYGALVLGAAPRSLGAPQLHHGGQMPGSGVFEIDENLHRCKDLHKNKWNQGVTNEMREADRKLHWSMRAQEQGCGEAFPEFLPTSR